MTTPTQYPPLIQTREDLKAACALIVAMGMPDPRTVRFWYLYRLSWVRITLQPGQTLRHSFTYWNGEGRTGEAVTFHYDAEARKVVCDWYEAGRDCDGFSSSRWMGECPVEMLQHVPAFEEYTGSTKHLHDRQQIYCPQWQKVQEDQRDEYAERAGY